MTWLTWRQHRAMALAFLALFGSAAVFFVLHGLVLRHDFAATHLSRCVGVLNDPDCAGRRRAFLDFDIGQLRRLGLLPALGAGMLGVFLGAPMVATEFEHGTWQWVWTQGVSRTRWLAVKLGYVALAVCGLCCLLATAYGFWNGPVATLAGPFTPFESFDSTPLLLCAYALFAFAAGVLASCLLRRTIVATGVALLVFVAARIGVTFGLRPHYQEPLTATSTPTDNGPLAIDLRDWDIASRFVDARGNTVSEAAVDQLTNPGINPAAAGSTWAKILQQHGIHYVDLVQPYTRAGTFQLIEAGLYLTASALCVAAAFWKLRRRIG